MVKIGGCRMSAPELSKELNDLIDRIGHAEPTVDNILIFAFLEELRDRRKEKEIHDIQENIQYCPDCHRVVRVINKEARK